MLSFLNQYAANYFTSQNGEEGILFEVIRRLDEAFQIRTHGHAVEIGGSNGLYCSNTAWLLMNRGWLGLFVEGDYSLHLESKRNWQGNPRVRHQCCYVDEKNINAFVSDDCDLLSLDTDGSDYAIFNGLKARPKIVVMEIDSGIPPDVGAFNSDGAAGYFRGVELGLGKGYVLLAHTGNLLFVRADYSELFPELRDTHPLLDHEMFFNQAWLKEEARA